MDLLRPERVEMRAGVISVNGAPFLKMKDSADAGVFLLGLGFRGLWVAGVWHYWKPADKRAA
jgi:hypothetical protein